MKVRHTIDGNKVTIVLEGDLSFSANEEFHGLLVELSPHKGKQIDIDLSGVGRIDSVGLGLLYIAKEDLGGVGSEITLISPRDTVYRMLELTEAENAFKIRR